MSIGKQLLALSNGNQEILPTLSQKIDDHKEWPLLQLCLAAAKEGKHEANIGKCMPPSLEGEEIFFREDNCNRVIAYWA